MTKTQVSHCHIAEGYVWAKQTYQQTAIFALKVTALETMIEKGCVAIGPFTIRTDTLSTGDVMVECVVDVESIDGWCP